MSDNKYKYGHLVSNVPNTQENRDFIKKINKMSKESKSIYKLYIRYRKPKDGFHYGSHGSLKRENANAFSVYIQDRTPWREHPQVKRNFELIKEVNALAEENTKLKRQIILHNNPYISWSENEIGDAIFELKEDIIDGFIDKTITIQREESLTKRYKELTIALAYVQGEDKMGKTCRNGIEWDKCNCC